MTAQTAPATPDPQSDPGPAAEPAVPDANRSPGIDDVVAAFNVLGYAATFAAASERLASQGFKVGAQALYDLYSSREALGAMWLARVLRQVPKDPRVFDMFMAVLGAIFGRLESRRDFSRAWLMALKAAAPLEVPQVHALHGSVQQGFVDWLAANAQSISVPDTLQMPDVQYELADAMCAITLGLVAMWELDRSPQYRDTWKVTESVAYLLDAALMSRPEFRDAGLLTHVVRLLDVPHQRFVQPVLDAILKPERAQALTDAPRLIEALRSLRPTFGPVP